MIFSNISAKERLPYAAPAVHLLFADLGEERHEQRDEGHDGEDAEHSLPRDEQRDLKICHVVFLLNLKAAARDSGSCRPRAPIRSDRRRSRRRRASAGGWCSLPPAPSSGRRGGHFGLPDVRARDSEDGPGGRQDQSSADARRRRERRRPDRIGARRRHDLESRAAAHGLRRNAL